MNEGDEACDYADYDEEEYAREARQAAEGWDVDAVAEAVPRGLSWGRGKNGGNYSWWCCCGLWE